MSRTFVTIVLAFSSALALSTIAATPAIADQADASSTRTVSYSDLDLSTPSGVATLDGRIRGAVDGVCGRTSRADFPAQAEIRRCRRLAMADASSQRYIVLARANSRGIQLAASR